MTGFLQPKGPEPDIVYWRRRALVLLGALFTVGLFWKILSSSFGEPAEILPAPVTSEFKDFSSLIPSVAPVPSQTPIAMSPSPVQSAGSNSDSEPKTCSSSDVSVTVAADRKSTVVGGGVHLKLTVTNESRARCNRDVGSGANEVYITAGDTKVWSSDYCNPSTSNNIQSLGSGESRTFTVIWNGKITRKNCDVSASAGSGTYQVLGRNKNIVSVPSTFRIE